MKGKVLIIEDNQEWIKTISKFLKGDGFHVEVSNNIEETLFKIKNELFHFITIDMNLFDNREKRNIDDYEGWKVIELIKKHGIQYKTGIMIITGHGKEFKDNEKLKNAEGIFYMDKGSFDKEIFLNLVNSHVEKNDLRFFNDFRD